MKTVSAIVAGLFGIAILSILVNPHAKTSSVMASLGSTYANAITASEGTFASTGKGS